MFPGPLKEHACQGAEPACRWWDMVTRRLSEGSALSVDEVVSASRRNRREVMRAIDSRQLRARQEKGEWVVLVEDMRAWLART